MDVATEFLFGESVFSLKDQSTDTSTLFTKMEMMEFVDAFFRAEKTTAMSMILADLYWMPQLSGEFRRQCRVVHGFVDTYVRRRLGENSGGNGSGSEKSTAREGGGKKEKYVVLDALVAEIKDPKELREKLLNILLAGSDTISGTLGFLVASLAQYPRIFAKLREIILEEFGSFEQPRGEITLQALRNCTYLQWCLNEVLRVYPAVPVNFKESVRDTTLPVGGGADGQSPVFIPKGHLVAWEVRSAFSRATQPPFLPLSKQIQYSTDFSPSSGQCTPTPRSGAPPPTNSSPNAGKAANSDSITCLSMRDRVSVSGSNSRSQRSRT